jgi:K+-sensing histidine kinase KdpD
MSLTPVRTPQRLEGLVEASLKRSSPKLAKRDLAVTHQVAPDVPEYAMDARLIGEAIDILIEESIRRAEQASTLRVTVRANRHAVMFAVKASGSGLTDVQREMLFTGEATPGTLARARAIITAHGGMAWANGIQGKGVTYYFTLPGAPPGPPESSAGL